MREVTYLNGVVDRWRGGANVPVTSAVLEGPVAEALEEQVEVSGADLLILTTHGRGPLSRFWLGSVADQLMRKLHVPMLLVRPQGDVAPEPRLERILVSLDGSPFAEEAIGGAMALAKPFGAAVALFMAVEPAAPIADPSGLVVLPPSPNRTRSGATRPRPTLTASRRRLRRRAWRSPRT
ncbi:MAG: universal stress protein [Gemmatimonadetes bacterium]|nr:universal stress protein [Gemmatimonadota bacterium]